jgi:hypothetical protein
VIANGYLRLDPQEWVRAVEKRRAALGRRRPGVFDLLGCPDVPSYHCLYVFPGHLLAGLCLSQEADPTSR